MSASSHTLGAPMRGVIVVLDEVPDPVFADATMGPGIAIDPLENILHAPCAGEIAQCARTQHALTLRTDDGGEWLMHIGLDTVDLQGEGFEMLVAPGQRVAQGEPLCRFDADRLARQATALITPMILTNDEGHRIELLSAPGSVAERGAALLRVSREDIAPVPNAGISSDAETRRDARLAAASGLHARPAARLRALAREHQVELQIESAAGSRASSESLSALLNLGLRHGDRVTIVVKGARAEVAANAAVALLENAEPGGASTESAAGSDEAGAKGFPVEPPDEKSDRRSAAGVLNGLPASPGLAIGPLRHFDPPLPAVAETGDDPESERRALQAALAAVAAALNEAQERARRHARPAEADIFEAHQAWLEDPDLRAAAQARIEAGCSAGRAWFEALEPEIAQLSVSDNAVLIGRAADLRDLQRQVMGHLSTATSPDIGSDIDAGLAAEVEATGAILVARDLTPSQFVAVAEGIDGLCLAAGGTTSHVAILARARGVPCAVAFGDALMDLDSGEVCLDAQRGTLEFAPDAERRRAFRLEREGYHQKTRMAQADAAEPAITRDGRRVHVVANVSSASQARLAAGAGAEGVGLLRSEFLFLSAAEAPTAETQREEYLEAARAFAGRPVTVRLLDIGADKQLAYVTLPAAPNPALGERGVRLWQTLPELFDGQLDALLRAAAEGSCDEQGRPALRIMVPMVSDATELRWVRERMTSRARALGIERLPALGAMIEVPSAALCAASLSHEADFLSIGTNDLTQYALAMDREVATLAARNDGLHPGVLRLIALCLQGVAGRCPVGVCGAAAGDRLAAMVLVAMGVDELSVEPGRVASLKAELREFDAVGLEARLASLMALADARETREAIGAWLQSGDAATPTTEP